MSNSTFDLNVFIRESKDVLVNPKSYFSTMKSSGGIGEPLIKAVIYGVIAGIFVLLWSFLHLGYSSTGNYTGAVGVMAFVWYIIAAVIGLFIGAVLVLAISSVCKGRTDFEACARVTASIMVVMPIIAFLGILSGLNFYLRVFIGLAVNLFALWLLYNALVEALKAKKETSKIVMYVLVGIWVLFMLVGLNARKRTNQLMKEYRNSDLKELFKDYEPE